MKNVKCFFILMLLSAQFVFAEALINYPPVKDITLPNGLRMLLIEKHEQQTISYRILVKAARADQPLGKEGIADLTSQLLQEGTSTKTSDQIADEIAAIGSQLSISPMPGYTIFGLDVLTEYSQTGLDILAEIILNPSFPSQGFKRVKNEMLNKVDMDLTDNDIIAFNHGRSLLLSCGNPLGRSNTKKSVQSISLKDVRNFYQNHFLPNNSILLVIGDFSNNQMLSQIKERFGSWKQGEVPNRVQTNPDFSKEGRIRIVDKPGMTQAVIYMNQWAPTSKSAYYYDYLIANYILGGGDFSSRLTNAVRSKGGMTYSIGSFCNIHSSYGVLNISTSTRNQELFNAYNMIKAEIEKLDANGIISDELQQAQEYISGSIPLQLEAPPQIANKILNSFMQSFSIDDLSKEVINFNNVTIDGVNSVIKKYMQTEMLNVVIVCDVKKVESQLKQIGNYEKINYKNSPCK